MADKLTARRVATIKTPGKYGDGRGLWLRVRSDGQRWWVLRYRFQGRDREMGLGGAWISRKLATAPPVRGGRYARSCKW